MTTACIMSSIVYTTSQLIMRLWYLSHRRPAKAQASLRIRAVSPEPSLFAHMKYGSRRRVRPKFRHLAPLDGCACAFEEGVYGGQKVPKSHELAPLMFVAYLCYISSHKADQQNSAIILTPTPKGPKINTSYQLWHDFQNKSQSTPFAYIWQIKF